MVIRQIAARGIQANAVLDAMRNIPRHRFVPDALRTLAYNDTPLPIGFQQTISQPYMVAVMTELLDVGAGDTVLEVGTGSGYQAAVLAEIVAHVYTIEIVEPLATQSAARLAALGYSNVTVRAGDGYAGWPEHAPFDGIIVTAGADHVPQPLMDQLRVGARMVIPVGDTLNEQHLQVLTKRDDATVIQEVIMPVRFVPLTGEHTPYR